MSASFLPAQFVRAVRKRAGGVCEYCRLPQESQEATFHIDHIIPRSAGGQTATDNLALACVSCSLHKAARLLARDPRTGALVTLFNPREDRWVEHFSWTPTWRLTGKTSSGRATVSVLKMNRPAIIAIRQQLAALQLFPLATPLS